MQGAPDNEILMIMVNILMMLMFKRMTHNQNDRVTPQNKKSAWKSDFMSKGGRVLSI